MKWWLPCVMLALASCGAPAGAARPGTLMARGHASPIPSCQDLHAGGGPRACAIATFDPEAGQLEVFLRIEPDALPVDHGEVRVAFGGEARSLGHVSEPVELRYTIALASEPAPGSSFRRAAGWHLVGRSFLPEIRVDGELAPVPATLLLEVGDTPLYTSAGPTHRVFDATSFTRLADEAFEVGPVALSRREVDGDTLWVAGSGRGDGELEVSADALATAYRHLHELLGDAPADSLLAALHPPESEPWSEREGTSIVWALGSSPDPEVALADALLPLVQIFLSSPEPWLAEGVARYLAITVGAELLDLDAMSVARALVGPTRSGDPSDRGAVVGFCLDGYLRQRSSSLGAWLRRARGGPLTSEELLADLGAVLPDAAGYLAALLDGDAEAEIEPCLERVGLRSEVEALDAPSEEELRDALGVMAWRPLSTLPLLRIDEVAAGSPLQRGDLLLAVADLPIGGADDVAWALRATPPGTQVALRIRRRGDASTVLWTVPAFDATASVARTHVTLTPSDAAAP